MRKLIFLIVFLLLAGGGGGGWWYYTNYMNPGEEAAMADEAATQEVKYEYVELTPVHLPYIDRDGVQQMISLVVVLEVNDKEAANRIKKQEPRLVNAYLTHMYSNMNNSRVIKDGVLQAESVRQRMEKITHRILEDEDIHDVLLQMVNQRRV